MPRSIPRTAPALAALIPLLSAALPGLPAAADPPPGPALTATPRVQSLLDQVNAVLSRGATTREEIDEARVKLDAAVAAARQSGDTFGEAAALNLTGLVCSSLGDDKEAIGYWEKALALRQKIGDDPGEARTLGNLGSAYNRLGQPAKGADFYEKALLVRHKLGDVVGEAGTLNTVAQIYDRLGQVPKALDYYEKAAALFRQAGNAEGEGYALKGAGGIHGSQGRTARALRSYETAVARFRAASVRVAEAALLNDMASLYSRSGEPAKALQLFNQALRVSRETGSATNEAVTLSNMGVVYRTLGQLEMARRQYELALPLAQKAGDRVGEATILGNIGVVLERSGRHEEALTYSVQALQIAQEEHHVQQQARMHSLLGDVYVSLGRTRDALNSYEKALPLRRQASDADGEAATLDNMAILLATEGDLDGAFARAREGGTILRSIGNTAGLANGLTVLAALHLSRGNYADAEAALRESISLRERLRGDLPSAGGVRAAYLEFSNDHYRLLASLLLRRGDVAGAFAVVQKVKGRTLLDRLGGAVPLAASLTDDERAQDRELRAACDRLTRKMIVESVRNEPGAKAAYEQDRAELAKAETALATFLTDVDARHPDQARRRTAKTATLAEVAAKLPSDACLVEFAALPLLGRAPSHSGKEKKEKPVKAPLAMYAFAVTRDAAGKHVVTVGRVTATYDELTEKLDDLRAACTDPSRPWRGKAKELYRLLLGPVEKQIAGKKRLVLCPDGPLWGTPVTVLADSGGRTLQERTQLVFDYSASGMIAAETDRKARPSAPKGVLVVANPEFGDESRLQGVGAGATLTAAARPISAPDRPITAPDRAAGAGPDAGPASSLVRGGKIAPLPGTQREADSIGESFGAAAVLLTAAVAQEKQVKEAMASGRYKYLHVATHGFLNEAAPLQSCLVLAQPPKEGPGSEEDGFLTAREIFDLDLSGVQMAVLSACNTARGQNQSAEGVVGLTWALFAAGCPTQVVSQWPVNDASTATLMQRFYAGLKAGKPKSAALREAALSLAKDPATAHPYYWAPFILVGDGR